MTFRIYHEQKGGHTHCDLFVGTGTTTFTKAGEFILRNNEFECLRIYLTPLRKYFEFIKYIPDTGD